MHSDISMIIFRTMLLVQLLAVLTLAGNLPIGQEELNNIWKKLKTPLFPKRPPKTNHKSDRFWEIDMTKLEP